MNLIEIISNPVDVLSKPRNKKKVKIFNNYKNIKFGKKI